MMVRNLHPTGPKWIPGIIMKQTGPLSYIVQVEHGLEWKRHIDHLRDYIKDTSLESQTSLRQLESDIDDFAIPRSEESTREVFEGNNETPEANQTTETIPEVESSCRYPTRVHNAPDRYM